MLTVEGKVAMFTQEQLAKKAQEWKIQKENRIANAKKKAIADQKRKERELYLATLDPKMLQTKFQPLS